MVEKYDQERDGAEEDQAEVDNIVRALPKAFAESEETDTDFSDE